MIKKRDMKEDFSSNWKKFGYLICALVACWGLLLVFADGEDSGGRILLMIAATGFFSTVLYDSFDNHMKNKN